MIQTFARSCTKSSESRTSPIETSVAIISGRLRIRSTTRPNAGAIRPGAASTKNTSPAAAFDPVSVFTHTLSARYMARSPNSESDWPTSSRRALRSARSARTAQFPVSLGGSGKPAASTCTGVEPSGRRAGSIRSAKVSRRSVIIRPTSASSSLVR